MAETIEALKRHFAVSTDADLARALGVDKSTVSSWKARHHVPARVADVLTGQTEPFMSSPPVRWGQANDNAFQLAQFRFMNLFSVPLFSRELRPGWFFLDRIAALFWTFMSHADKDIRDTQVLRAAGSGEALLVILHDEMEEPDAAAKRDLERLRQTCGGQSWDELFAEVERTRGL